MLWCYEGDQVPAMLVIPQKLEATKKNTKKIEAATQVQAQTNHT